MRRIVLGLWLLFVSVMQASPMAQAAPLQQDCSGVVISSPRASGDPVRGRVNISGSATIPNFQFYKVEYASGNNPPDSSYRNIAPDVRRSAVASGLLEAWDTTGIPDGSYALRLTVVDIRGNFPCPPVVVQPIIVANRAPVASPTSAVTPTETATATPAGGAPTSAVTRPSAPTIALPTSAVRGTSTITATRTLSETTTSRPLIPTDLLPNVSQALTWGVCGMGILLVAVGVYVIARYIFDRV